MRCYLSDMTFFKNLSLKIVPRTRAAKLLSTLFLWLIAGAIADFLLSGGQIFQQIFHPDKDLRPQWKDLVQILFLLGGLPVVYLIWHWRDTNTRDQIENQRRDTNLKDFHEVIKTASSLTSEDSKNTTSHQLAAIHLLISYLRGDHGESFKRPAFEVIAALASHPRHNTSEDIAYGLSDDQEKPPNALPVSTYNAVRDIIFEANSIFFSSGSIFKNKSLRGLNLPRHSLINNVNFICCDFSYSTFDYVTFQDCTFDNCRFEKFSMLSGEFIDCNIINTIALTGDFSGTYFYNSAVSGVFGNVSECDFKNSSLAYVEFHNSKKAKLSPNTKFGHDFIGIELGKYYTTSYEEFITKYPLDTWLTSIRNTGSIFIYKDGYQTPLPCTLAELQSRTASNAMLD